MKKQLLILLLLLSSSINLFASHAMGGEITAQQIGFNMYELTAKFYRDAFGISAPTNLQIEITDPNGLVATTLLNNTGFTAMGNSTEEYIYTGSYLFPTTGNYKLTYTECCRNAAILNIVNASGYSMYIDCEIWVDPTNSSPTFLNPPVPVAQLNVPFIYNPLPFDVDGDSLAWYIDTPYDAGGVIITGYSLPPTDPLSPFTMNSATGEITFLPNATGNFVVSCIVQEFRNGVQIGYIRREMQIIVLTSFNIPPLVTTNSSNFPYSGKTYSVSPGSSFNVSVNCIDPDGNMSTVYANGEPFLLQNNPATYTVNTVSTGNKVIDINWNTTVSQNRISPYLFCVRYADIYGNDIFNTDLTFSISVNNLTGIEQLLNNQMLRSVYPNPSNGNFTIEINSERDQNIQLELTNMIGQVVKIIPTEINSGLNLISLKNDNLKSGKYILNVISEGKISGSIPLEIK